MATEQEKLWRGRFGVEYTDRNTLPVNDSYMSDYGITRTEMNIKFLNGLNRNMNILEVGAGMGKQLLDLKGLGFTNLRGIELQSYAVNMARSSGLDVKKGSALALPFNDKSFEMVFTSGFLIHIAPEHISQVLDEIYRCSKRYIWGMEYYSHQYTPVIYRGLKNMLWKANFVSLYQARFPSLHLIRQEFYKYKTNDEEDMMFLLKKAN